jgi:RNA-binding protein
MAPITNQGKLAGMTEALSNAQIRKLKGMAQKMEATLKVGKNGLSPAFLQSLNQELARHELVKVRFADFKEQRKELAPQLAEKTGAHLVTLLGNVAVLYREKAPADLKEPGMVKE